MFIDNLYRPQILRFKVNRFSIQFALLQIHSFKPGATGIQALGNTVTIAQVLPPRTQAVVYSTNTSAQFTPTARITVASSVSSQRQPQARPMVSLFYFKT